MERDREAFEAKLAEYEGLMKFAILPADPAAFKAGWQAALAYVRGERGQEKAPTVMVDFSTMVNGFYHASAAPVREVSVHDNGTIEVSLDYWPKEFEDGESPVTESSGCVFRDLNVSPPSTDPSADEERVYLTGHLGLSPVTHGGRARRLPAIDDSWFVEDVRRASERQAKITAELPSSNVSPPEKE